MRVAIDVQRSRRVKLQCQLVVTPKQLLDVRHLRPSRTATLQRHAHVLPTMLLVRATADDSQQHPATRNLKYTVVHARRGAPTRRRKTIVLNPQVGFATHQSSPVYSRKVLQGNIVQRKNLRRIMRTNLGIFATRNNSHPVRRHPLHAIHLPARSPNQISCTQLSTVHRSALNPQQKKGRARGSTRTCWKGRVANTPRFTPATPLSKRQLSSHREVRSTTVLTSQTVVKSRRRVRPPGAAKSISGCSCAPTKNTLEALLRQRWQICPTFALNLP